MSDYNKRYAVIENSSGNENEFKRRKILYFCKINKQAIDEIDKFIAHGIPDFLNGCNFDALKRECEHDGASNLFFCHRYKYAWHRNYYSIDYPFDIIAKVSEYIKEKYDFTEMLGQERKLLQDYAEDPKQFWEMMDRYVDEDNVMGNILERVANAVREGKFWEQAERAKKARLRIGCLNEQYFHIWQNLLTFSREIEDRYAPVCMRYESREALYRAIQMNKADITFQLRDSQIEQYGLTFVPLTSYPLLCIPAYLREPLKAEVTFEELSRYRLAFHYGPGNTLYEDNLRTALRAQYPGVHILEPEDFFSADYGTPTLILVPEIDYTGNPSKASRLVWNGEIPAGFIHGSNVSDTLLAFEQWIQDNFQ